MAEMQALKCTVCGGTLRMQENGEFSKCESCGVEYTLPTMQKMVRALEGASLNVKGLATEDSLINYARSILERNTPDAMLEASEKFKEVLELNSQNSKAWKGLFDCASYFWPKEMIPDTSAQIESQGDAIKNLAYTADFNLQKAIQYSGGEERASLEVLQQNWMQHRQALYNYEQQSAYWKSLNLCRYCGGKINEWNLEGKFMIPKCSVCGRFRYQPPAKNGQIE